MIKLPFNHARDALKALKPAEQRLETWNVLLKEMFALEEELLMQALQDTPFEADKERIDYLKQKEKECRERVAPYVKLMHGMITRLGKAEDAYRHFAYEITCRTTPK